MKVARCDNIADLLTKSVTPAVHAKLLELLPVDVASWTVPDTSKMED